MIRRVVGESMLPTLRPGMLVWADKNKQPHIGSIVIAKKGNIEIIKRVVAVNAKHVRLEGDNASRSSDSRTWGTLPATAIIATVVTALDVAKLKITRL